MTRISQTIKNIVSGISQQPNILRLPEQLDEQVNGFSTESSGLQKRPPTLHVAHLGTKPANQKPKVHIVNRDENEKYIMMFDGEKVSVWDETGKSYSVSYTSGAADYIKAQHPREELRVITIADYTFIVNTKKTVKMSDRRIPENSTSQGALLHIKSGQYGRTYTVTVNGSNIASYTTPNGSNADDSKAIDTNNIRNNLASQMEGKGWQVTRLNSCVYFTKSGTKINSIHCEDGFNNTAMVGILKTVQKFTDLPAQAPNGYTVKVMGSTESGADDYYVSYNYDQNIWKECAKPGILAGYDAHTLPHVLVRNADFTFTLKAADWEDRKTGDEDSNPEPSFIDNRINDLFFFRNRLGFLSGENIIMSKSASFFDFWIASAVEIQDTDPIDLAVSHNQVSTLYHAVPFNKELLLFAADTQFVMSPDGVLTPQNANAPQATEFTSDVSITPVAAGRRVYYVAKRAQYSSLWEYFTADDTLASKDAQDITSHVPSLIPNRVYNIWASNTENVLLVGSSGDPSRIYVYKYLFVDGSRIQSSWSYWQFKNAEIIGGGFIDSTFYLLILRGGELFMEKMIFTYNTKDYNEEAYRVFLDRKGVSAPIEDKNYDAVLVRTQLHLKAAYDGALTAGSSYGVVLPDGKYHIFDYDTVKNDQVYIQGDLRGQKVTFGEIYNFRAVLSQLMVKRPTDSGGMKAETEGRLQLIRVTLNFSDSGYFEVHVSHNDTRDDHVYYHTSRILGADDNKLGIIPMETGHFMFPIMSVNDNCGISIETEAPTAVSFVGYIWEGNYIKRTKSL